MARITKEDYEKLQALISNDDKHKALDILEKYAGNCSELRDKIRKYDEEENWAYRKRKGEKIGYKEDPARGKKMLELLNEISNDMQRLILSVK